MSLAADIRAGGAYVELRLKDHQYVAGLRSAHKQLNQAAGVMTGIGGKIAAGAGLVTAGIGGMMARFAQVGGDIDDMSQRTGVAVEQLSSLSYAAKLTGSGAEDLEKSLRKMQVNLAEVASGSTSAAAKLEDIGVSYQDLKDKSPDEQFRIVADAISKIEDPGKKAAAAMDIFGKSGANLLPMMNGGAEGIRALEEEARSLGLVMSTDQAQASASFGDAMDKAFMVVGRVSDMIAFAFAPALTNILEWLARVSSGLIDFIDRNRETIVLVGAAVVGLLAFGVALMGAGYLATAVGAVFGLLASVIAGIGSAIGIASGAIASALAFLMSPIGLVVAAIVGFGAAVLYYTGTAGAAWDWLAGKAGELLGEVLRVFDAVKAAFMAGDLGLAAEIAWAGIEMIWLKATGGIMSQMQGWWNSLRGLWSDGWYGLVGIMASVGSGIQQLWADITHGIYDRWNWTVGKVSEGLIRATATAQGLTAEETQAWVDESNAMTDQAAKESAANYQRTTDAIGKNLGGTLSEIEADHQASRQSIAQDEQQRLSAAVQKLKDAESRFAALSSATVGPQLPSESGQTLSAAMAGVPAAALGSSASSTFRASEVGGLAAGSPVEKILKDSLTAQQETATNTKSMGKVR